MKIFVAKLASRTTAEDLRAYFEQFGKVDVCKVIMDHDTGRSKCYGFVEMPNDDEAYRAIVETDDMEFQGNVLQVRKSRPQTEKAQVAKPVHRDRTYTRPNHGWHGDKNEA